MGILGLISLVAGIILLAAGNQDWFAAQEAVGLGATIVGAVLLILVVVRTIIQVVIFKRMQRGFQREWNSNRFR
jgi:hypothetical protein